MTALFSHGRRTLAAALVLLLGVMVGGVSVITDAAPANATTATTSISGTITLPVGVPTSVLQDVSVVAYGSLADVDLGGTSGSVNSQNGTYTISGLAPGTYRVAFDGANGLEGLADSEYFGGTGFFSTATPVSTSVSSPATGVDITLQLGATITGTVHTSGGAVASGAEAYLVDLADPEHELQDFGSTDPAGLYTIAGLLPGSYKVMVDDSGSSDTRSYVGGSSYAAASTITIAAGSTISGQDVVLPAAVAGASSPGAPSVSLTSTTATTATLTWNAPSSVDPILSYDVSPSGGVGGGGVLSFASTGSTGQITIVTGGLSNVVFVSAMTGVSTGSDTPIVLNQSADPTAPVISAVVSGNSSLTVTVTAPGSAPSDAWWWFAYLPTGGQVAMGDNLPEQSSTSFDNVSLTSGGTVYAGWFDNGGNFSGPIRPVGATAVPAAGFGDILSQSQVATLAIAPGGISVNAWFQAKWQQLGGASGSLGQPTAAMQCQSSSCWQQFAGGVLTSDGSEIVELSTAYVSTWLANGGPDGELGLVAGPESCFGTYCVTPFTHGVVTWTPNVGVTATVVNAWFEAKWKQLGGVTGSLGSPTAAMQCQSSSCWQQFTGGVLTSDGHEIVKLSSAYVSTWLAWGGPNGDLGLVNGSEACYGTYCQTPFAGGVIVWVPNSGVYPVAKNWFLPAWTAHGGASGSLGLPTAAMQCQSAACYQVFQNGTLTSSTTGIVALSSAYVSTWLADGGPNGSLGLVAGPEQCFSTYCQVPFQHGTLVWQPGVGVHLAS